MYHTLRKLTHPTNLSLVRVFSIAVGWMLSTAIAAADGPNFPFPQHVNYAWLTLRPTSSPLNAQDNDVRAFYDYWKAAYLVDLQQTPSQYRIAAGKAEPESLATFSEGQGYGMVIVALMAGHDPNAQEIFDGLWRFSRANPSGIDSRLMQWRVPLPDQGASDSAFDGDADIAYALLLAHAQWGSSGLDYQAAARTVLNGLLESTVGPRSGLPMLGDWVNPSGTTYNQDTPRTSDLMPAHFTSFGRATGNLRWAKVVCAAQFETTALQLTSASQTGLYPDFAVPCCFLIPWPKPAPPGFLEGPNDGFYSYNACRNPWRIGTHALLNGDLLSRLQMWRLTHWIERSTGGDPQRIHAGYQLNGTPIAGTDYFTSAFAGPLAVAAMTTPGQQTWLNALYEALRTQHENYYEDSINLQCLLILTGNYWDPSRSGTKPASSIVR